ncbi:MAG: hypothetical protein IT376_16170 [Polyangiaceae bacterium]|nr:hypothetical protein [Polyangiaceae bacterium]
MRTGFAPRAALVAARRLVALLVAVWALAWSAAVGAAEPEAAPPAPEPAAGGALGDAPRVAPSRFTIPTPPGGFNTYDGGWIRFAYEPGARQRVQPLIQAADEVRRELSERLGRPVLQRVTVHVARTPGEMAALAPRGAPPPDYASGVAYADLGLVVLTLTPPYATDIHDLTEVFRHELAHVALHDAVGGRHVPRWFNEGFAVHASGESALVRLRTLWTATLAETLLPLSDLERRFPSEAMEVEVAYAQAADVVRFLLRRQDAARFAGLVTRLERGEPFEVALTDAYGSDVPTLEREWREDVARRYTFWPVFFSGTTIWAGALGLFVWGYRRKRRQAQATLARWAREEAREDAARQLARPAPLDDSAPPRMHVVIARNATRPPALPDGEVPKVQHDGSWHTLH